MQLNGVTLIFIYMLLCLSLNYTFPLHRETIKLSSDVNSGYANSSWHWDDILHHGIVERSKKMASNIGNAMKKIRNTAQDFGRNIYSENNVKRENNKLSDEDLRQYEQLVIMKKYPYLDVKELEYQYSPLSNKNTRQSWRIEPESHLRDSILYEPEESINVEIINRGLSGFSIPPKLLKGPGYTSSKVKQVKNNEQPPNDFMTLSKKSSKESGVDRLVGDIVEYEVEKNKI